MELRVIILAGGSGLRWGNYRGVPKHLVEIEGEVLLERTVKQFLKHTSDVWVVGPDNRYKFDGANLYTPEIDDSPKEMSKFISSHDLWLDKKDSKNILVFGDVYFTDEAVKTIVSDKGEWNFFVRRKGSIITGKPHKEIFAISFNNSTSVIFSHKIFMLYVKTPTISTAGGWHLFRELTIGNPFSRNEMFKNGGFVEINDWTEDFDYPKDLENWEKSRSTIWSEDSSIGY
jgi:hypothetical protein